MNLKRRPCRRALFELEELEPRLLFSADPLVSTVLTGGIAVPLPSTMLAASPPDVSTQASQHAVSAQAAGNARELVFVDMGIEQADTLLADLAAQQEQGRALTVVRIEAGADGISVITRYLSSQMPAGGFDAVHVLSHGDGQGLTLGTARLDNASMVARLDEVSRWQRGLNEGADLLFYGCDLSSTEAGRLLVGGLSQLTGADVAASDDLTGTSLLGGDWDLEYQVGQVDTQALFGQWRQPAWWGVLATYTVTSTVDNASSAATAGTLRWAITQANANAGADTIAFNITGTAGSYGEYTITPYTAMPTISDAVTIDGSTQPGYGAAGHPLIVLDGNGASAYGIHLNATSDGSTIRGLVIRDFTSYGIYLPAGSDNQTIVGNYIGSFNADGSNAGVADRNDAAGIYNHGANLKVGGTSAADRNVISGNGPSYNIYLGTGSDNAALQGNYLGTNAAGTAVFANSSLYGVMVESSSTGVVIGGSAPGAGNVVAGFSTYNLWLTTTGTTTVQGNYIGTNATGTAALGGGWGVYVDDGGSALIGGTAAGAGNVISGNGSGGIYAVNTDGITAQGNIIGLNASGTAALANTGVGIDLRTPGASIIGGATAAERNVIAGNTGHGLNITTSAGHKVQGNYIGVGLDGSTLLGNGGAGIYIAASNVVVGGKNAGEGNVIAGNSGAGIAVASGNGNLFYRNSIHSNGGLGIDLENDGVTSNDTGDGDGGANYRNNYPVITSAFSNGTVTKVTGSLEWYAQAQPVYIEFYASPTVDASGYGEGRTYLGFVQVTTNAATGDVSFSVDLPTVAAGQYITAVTNVEAGSIGASEFSAAVQVVAAATGNRGKAVWTVNDQAYSWYANWNGGSFTLPAVTGVNTTDDITMMAAAESPTRNEVILIGSADASGKILAIVWNGSTWSAPLALPLATPAAAASQYHSFAVAYESASGDAMLVWDNGNTGTTGLSYAVWNGSSWSAINTITAPVSGEPYEMRIAAHPTTDEMVLVVETSAASSNQFALVWNGSSWGNAQTLGSDSHKDYFEINVAYESQSGRALVFYDNSASNQPSVQFRIWNGSSWSAESSISAAAGVSATAELYATAIASDPGSNRIALLAQTSTNNVWAAVWDGSTWGNSTVLTTTAPALTDSPMTASVAFESKSGDLLAVYSKNTGPNVFFRTWTSGGGWSSEQTGPSMGGTDVPYIIRLFRDPYTDTIMLGVQDAGQDLNFVAWNGSSWGTVTQLDGATGETYRQNFTYVWNLFNKTVVDRIAGDVLQYSKGEGPRVIDQGYAASVVDADTVGFAGGTLTVSLTGGSTASEDVLSIRHQGAGAGQIGLSGGSVTYEGVVIGTYTGGSSGSPLVVTLNASATAASVAALIGNVTYRNTNVSSPSAATRTVRFALVDALGVAAAPADASITVTNPSPSSSGISFQEGVGGYTGTQDTYVEAISPNTSFGNSTSLVVDNGTPNGRQTLIKFDNLFGNGPGQIPYGSIITSASLTVYVTNGDTADAVSIHRMLTSWSEASTFNSLSNGVSTNNVEAGSSSLYTLDAGITGAASFTGLGSSLQAWANGAANHGWVIVTGDSSADDWTIDSSETATASRRPVLNVVYTPPAPPDIDLDANNSSGASNSDFKAVFTENAGPVLVADTDAVITDADSTNLSGMTVTLVNPLNGSAESLSAVTTGTNITASYNSGTGVLTLSGSDTVARYQQVLRTVSYNNTSDAPDTTKRFITFSASDSFVSSASATTEVTIVALNDAPTGSVTISGTATQGQTLTAGNTLADADGMGTISYQWLRNGVAISGATGGTYVLTQADVGAAISVRGSYTDGYGTAESSTSAATASVANINDAPTGSVTISGTVTQGQTLTAGNTLADVDGMGTVSYQWLRNGVAISGATGGSYVLAQADVGTAISVRGSYTDGYGAAESSTSAATASIANINDAPTGSVTISGTATQGQTLTAGNTLADLDGMGTVSYQWLRNGVAISGATGSTYVLTQADVGTAMSVRGSYTDGYGAAESSTSVATASVANINDAPTGSVTISGTATQGQTLTAGNTLADVDGMGTVSYQWLRNGVAISGATGGTYVLTQADVGAAISVRGSYTDGYGAAESSTSAATASIANINDAPTGSVTISGTATQGQTLTAGNTLADADGLGTVSYQWLRNGVAISGATSGTYVLTQADVGTAISVRGSYTDGYGTAESSTSAATASVANINDAPTGAVTITGTATQGQTLTANNTLADVDGMGAVSYQWLRNGVAISGATSGTYVLTQADVGTAISVRGSYTDGYGAAESSTSAATAAVANVNDAPTGSVTISGTATQGQTLTANNTLADVDGMGTVSYQWLRNGVAVSGATGGTYVLTQADVGTAISVRSSYTDGYGAAESSTSAATALIANLNDAPIGSVTISGTATQGQTLTAGNTLADIDGMGTVGYQWLRDGVAISGATGGTYVLTQADVGAAISVRGSYTDGYGAAESSTSAATASVANTNDAPTGSVTISGTATQGQTLTAGNTLADVDGMGTVSYQWLRDGVAISGATGGSYVLAQADVGTAISVRGSYTDGYGAAESSTSAATASVANINDAPTGAVTITGTATQGQTLTANNTLADVDGMGTVSYQWLRNGVAISGATSGTYVLTQADVGTAISVRGSYTDGYGTAESSTSAATASVANINDAPTGSVTISGTATQGQTLTAGNTLADIDGMGTVSYQWLRNGVAISGATGGSYVLAQADVGTAISVRGSYTDGYGAAESSTSAATASVANINDAPTGAVTISGTAAQGQTLTAGNTLGDVDGMGTVSYQWLRNGVAISGATSGTYVLTQADVGTAISVRGSYTDGYGAAESSTSAATASIANINDAPTGSVTISGTATQGQTLTAGNTLADIDGMGTVSYQWLRDGVAISGATSGTYVLTQVDVGAAISVRGSYTDGYGAAESSTSAATASVANINDVPTGSVTISGTATQGQTLTAGNTLADVDGMGTVSYQWLRDGVAISGATGGSYVLAQADVGAAISVRGSYTDGYGAAESSTSAVTAAVANINDAPTGSVTISGTATQGQILTAGNTLADVDGMGTVSYQWLRNGVAISGATGGNYALTQTDVGAAISVRGSYTDGYGAAESLTSAATASVANLNDAPTGSVTISGTATQGQTLTAGNTLADIDGMGTVSYQWLRNGVAISGATSGTYVLTQADVGTAISVRGSYTDGYGAAESSTSAATASIANINDAPTGSVTISGTATQGQTLTAGNTLADVDGMGTVSYQWLRDGVAISGATSGTYVLTQVDVGAAISVRGSYTDGYGAAESSTSAATASVANINDVPTGSVTISGTATQGQTLTAGNTLADVDGMGTVSYQWLRDGVAISGATSGTHVLTQADVGTTISVRGTYTDGYGAVESSTSSATAAVANINDAPTGTVTISGAPAENQTLTAGNTLVDADGLGAVTYQWLRDGAAVSGATGTTYVLGQDDVGSVLSVRASYVDGFGAAESVVSAATGVVANANNAPAGAVVISGNAAQGESLTASNTLADADGLGSIGYQWLRDGVAISGAAGSAYVLTQDDVGTAISVRASYTDGHGFLESVTSAPTAAVANLNDAPTGSVTISGAAAQGQTLTAGNTLADADGMGTVTYQWLRDGVAIAGATGGTYVLTQADVGAAISVRGGYTDGHGAAESAVSAPTAAVANLNDVPSGSVIITGTAMQGQTLVASNTLADADGMGMVTYQWLRNGVAISGATGDTYVLSQADVGASISVLGSYTDTYGAAESALSPATTAVVNVNDSPTGSVTISGTATQGQTLTAGNTLADLDGMGTVSYQWLRNGVAISGASSGTYVLTQADVGAAISVRGSYTDGYGAAESSTSGATASVINLNDAPTGAVTITGTAMQGQTLTANNTLADLDGMGTVGYQWLRDGVAISGATSGTYVLTQADVGAAISVRGSYTDGYGAAESSTSGATASVINFNDAPTGAVTIAGTATQGQTLTAGNTLADADGMGTVGYQWLRNGVAISGATGGSYVLTQADVSTAISVRGSYTDGYGAAESSTSAVTASVTNLNDAPTGSVTISGTATQGQTLAAGNTLADIDGMGTVSYQWLRNGVAISGATGGSYVLTQADVGTAISVRGSYTDGYGAAESSTSAATASVTNLNDAPTGSVTISGTATQGQTLTANNTLADLDGMGTVSYQWLRNGVAISGATGGTYVLTQADVDAAISVRGSYTDGYGAAESSTSAVTASVANINDAPTGAVTITGMATQGQTLTANNTLADVDGMGTVSYQWLRNGVAISGATSGTYVLTQADVGTAISVRGSYTDGYGAAESSTSAATAAVANINDAPTGAVTISGTAAQGQTLTAGNTLADLDGMGTVSYQWLRNGVAISGATGGTYVLTQADVGAAISVRGSYTDGYGAAETSTSAATASVANINDAPTGAVTITGTATQGQTLTAGNTLADTDGMGIASYQWLRNGVAISGATSGTYVLTQADVGTAISVRGSYTDGYGAAESSTSAATAPVVNVNDAPTGTVTIGGTATQGQTLTAGNSLADADGMGIVSYQWLRNGAVIVGATDGSYLLTQADVGGVIAVQARYTDAQGTLEKALSASTAAVANVNDAPSGAVTITGTLLQGQTLTVADTLTDLDGMGTVSYQWLRDGVLMAGSQGAQLVLTQADVGSLISVRASYTDGHGAAESMLGTATATVANLNDAPTVGSTLAAQQALGGQPFMLELGNGLFLDPDPADSLVISASGLPAWLQYDSLTHTFSGTPTSQDAGTLTIVLTATDPQGASASSSFRLTVTAPTPDAGPVVPQAPVVVPATPAPAQGDAATDEETPPDASSGGEVAVTVPVPVASPEQAAATGEASLAPVISATPFLGTPGQSGSTYVGPTVAFRAMMPAVSPAIALDLVALPGLQASVPIVVQGGTSALAMRMAGGEGLLASGDGSGDLLGMSVAALESGGVLLSIGSIWWTARLSAIAASVLAATPLWRQFDPLPVMGDDENESGTDGVHGAQGDPYAAEAERMFDGAGRHTAIIE